MEPDSTDGRIRVSTRMYQYKLSINGEDQWRIHWHPRGGPVWRPHVHVLPDLTKHLPTGRITFEDAIEWCIELGATPTREDWGNILDASSAAHKLHRTWSDDPARPDV